MGRLPFQRDERPIIRIRRGAGWGTTRAELSDGLFAVHHDVGRIKTFTVTHGLTGNAVFRGLTRDEAIYAFHELNSRREYWRFVERGCVTPEARVQVESIEAQIKMRRAVK